MMSERDKVPDYLMSHLSERVQKLDKQLLMTDWKNIDFDLPDFARGVKLENSQLSEGQKSLVSLIVENIPEWKWIIGRKQHQTHDYTLDVHTLVVIKKIQSSEKYSFLTDYEKLILLYTALLHDIEKREGEIDLEHPIKGAQRASEILYRLGFGEDFIDAVYVLISDHQLLGQLASNKINLSNTHILNTPTKDLLIRLLLIFSIADIRAVKKKEAFSNPQIEKNFGLIAHNLQNSFNLINNF